MVYYVKQGILPESRHTYVSRDLMYREELFGEESFDGPYSLLYHSGEPTRVKSITRLNKKQPGLVEGEIGHKHLAGSKLPASGDFYEGRRYLLVNKDVKIGLLKPERPSTDLFRSAMHEQLFYVQRGNGAIRSPQGTLRFRAGDYVYVPKGTTYFPEYSTGSEFFFVETTQRISVPQRYMNIYGQLKEGSPYYSRDIRPPTLGYFDSLPASLNVMVDFGEHYVKEERDESMFDVVGWDGYLYPFALNKDSMAPIVGKLHMPPPVHETFSGKGFMVGTFLPRKFDFHPRSIPISYYHSNIDVDEVLFYSSGNFMSRKGISEGSITVHVRGLIHGPQPGMVENSIGKVETNEVAVMIETNDPLLVTGEGKAILDPSYMTSWYQ